MIDPLDGSKNAKRGLPAPRAFARRRRRATMADVVFGFVYDFGPDEEWVARARRGRDAERRRGSIPACPSGA